MSRPGPGTQTCTWTPPAGVMPGRARIQEKKPHGKLTSKNPFLHDEGLCVILKGPHATNNNNNNN